MYMGILRFRLHLKLLKIENIVLHLIMSFVLRVHVVTINLSPYRIDMGTDNYILQYYRIHITNDTVPLDDSETAGRFINRNKKNS